MMEMLRREALSFQGGYLPSYKKELLGSCKVSCHSEGSLGESKNPRIHVAPCSLLLLHHTRRGQRGQGSTLHVIGDSDCFFRRNCPDKYQSCLE